MWVLDSPFWVLCPPSAATFPYFQNSKRKETVTSISCPSRGILSINRDIVIVETVPPCSMTDATMHKLGKKMWCPGPWKTLSLPVRSSDGSTSIQPFFKKTKQNWNGTAAPGEGVLRIRSLFFICYPWLISLPCSQDCLVIRKLYQVGKEPTNPEMTGL